MTVTTAGFSSSFMVSVRSLWHVELDAIRPAAWVIHWSIAGLSAFGMPVALGSLRKIQGRKS
jgi:hypothetical protein